MIVKIGNTYYNSTEQLILLILSKEEKSHIANMEENKKKYLSFPSDYNINNAKMILENVPEWILKCIDC